MNAEDDTREIALEEPEEKRNAQPDADRGPWGAEAVQLEEHERDRGLIDDPARCPKVPPRHRTALVAVVCVAGAFAVLGALILSGNFTTEEIDRKEALKANGQPPVVERIPNRTSTAHQAGQRRRQVRRRAPHRHSTSRTPTTHPAPSPTYVPTPETAPAPEPVAPSRTPAPALESTSTTKPPPASGPTVAREFGFER